MLPERIISGSSEGDLIDQHRQIIASAAHVDEAHQIKAHRHRRAQLLFSCQGFLQISTSATSWNISSTSGIWISPFDTHQVTATQAQSYRSIFVEPELAASLGTSRAVEITPLLRCLIDEASNFGNDYSGNSPESRLMNVLYDQLCLLQDARLATPMPKGKKLQAIFYAICQQPDDNNSLKDWSRHIGASERTLSRAFIKETGMTFNQWRQHLLVSLAIERLAQGQTLTRVALDLGYRSSSAFGAMFRRVTGASPGQYMRTTINQLQ